LDREGERDRDDDDEYELEDRAAAGSDEPRESASG
jgi:hypothetical protein